MAHLFESGFTVREPAWHGLATVLSDYPGREDAMRIAGQDFRILEAKLSVEIDGKLCEFSKKDWKALIRDDTQALISVVKGSYSVVQNESLWDIADAIVSQDHVRYETAGVLKGGAVLWVLARLDEPSQVKGDDSLIYPYCLASTTHDGSGATRVQAVSIRVVCWNTFSAANSQAKSSGKTYTFRHTRNVMDRIEEAKEALSVTRSQHEDYIHLANELAGIEVDTEGVKDYIRMFIPEPQADIITDRVRRNINEARIQVWDIINHGPTIPDAHRRTAYGLWQAGIEYLDHIRRFRSVEAYFNRTMMDTSTVKEHLANMAREVAKV